MKTIAARFDDGLFAVLTLVAELEQTSIVDQIRTAVENHLAIKMSNGELSGRAEAALAEIDREAAAKKAAISDLMSVVKEPAPKPKSTSRRGLKSVPDQGTLDGEPKARAFPMGFAPARAGSS